MKLDTQILAALALLPLASAKCTSLSFINAFGGDGYTTTYNATMPVTPWRECKAAGNDTSCELDRSVGTGIGLVLHPDLRSPAGADDATRKHLFALVRESAGVAGAATNFNATIVVGIELIVIIANIMLSVWSIPKAALLFAPYISYAGLAAQPIVIAWGNHLAAGDPVLRQMLVACGNVASYTFNAWLPCEFYLRE